MWKIPLLILTFVATAGGQDTIPLLDPEKPHGGWEFGNGPEFPGAQGGLKRSAGDFRGHPVLALQGDFTEGGNYVQAAVSLPDVPVHSLSFWMHAPPGVTAVPIRLVDGTLQCHQLKLKLNDKGGWQKVALPVEEFFRGMGGAGALDIISQYEKWSGANDGRWHQPGKLLVILFSRSVAVKGEILFSDVRLHPGRPKTEVVKTIRLDEMLQMGEIDWEFNQGWEVAGAEGGLDLVPDQPEADRNALRLRANFTGGGAYVGMRKSFERLDVQAMRALHMKMRSKTATSYGVRLVDGTGQCHQRKDNPFQADGVWHDVRIVPAEIAGGEHWGGANDGTWHDPAQLIELMLNTRSSAGKTCDLSIADIRAGVVVQATVTQATFAEDFESRDRFAGTWHTTGDAKASAPGAQDTSTALVLTRTLDEIQVATRAVSEPFSARPGIWQVRCAWKSALHSPDNSYHGSVVMEALDRADRILEMIPVANGSGRHDWQDVTRKVEVPEGTVKARFRVELEKTYGSFHIDELFASRLKVQPIEQRIDRILLAGDALGNLFLPGQAPKFRITVEAGTPLPEDGRRLAYSVRDYWGALQLQPGELRLSRQARRQGHFVYTAEVVLPADGLEVGRYHELHVEIPQPPGDPVMEHTGFSVLPPAVTRNYPPEDVPFTIRNWDSRIAVYLRLADRLGLRMIGLWGGWSEKPPYRPHCPQIDLCRELNAKWITGTPASFVEREGFTKYSQEALRKGMRNFLEAYADKGLAMIAMGNEPHGTGAKVLANVRAYRAVYEAVKTFDPEIHVIGTSVEPNEEYFEAGYQDYLDSYDFHIYEHYSNVRRTMREYRALMQKYGAVKPIHSTELGLNSQGQTRLAVSREMIKKLAVFFAEGGATASWFTIQYPDPQGKARGQFGDSHCMFDCKYNLYNPRLDAITHYHILNSICVKKFVSERQYPGGEQAFLFRDSRGRCLQVLWMDGARRDVSVPLPANHAVELIDIDGSRQALQTTSGGVTVTLSDDPLLLLYDDAPSELAESLGEPVVSLTAEVEGIAPDSSVDFWLSGARVEDLKVDCPPLWRASTSQASPTRVDVTLHAPPLTTAREARVRVLVLEDPHVKGRVDVRVPVLQR